MDLGVMAMKRYSTFSRAPELEPHHLIVECQSLDLAEGFYSYAEMQLAYSIAPADMACLKIEERFLDERK